MNRFSVAGYVRRLLQLETAVSAISERVPSDVQLFGANAAVTLSLTSPLTLVETAPGGVTGNTYSLPTAGAANEGYTVTLYNVGSAGVTFNGVSVTSGNSATFMSTGADWRRTN